MKTWQEEQNRRPILQYRKGETVRVVQGPETGRTGTIIAVYPTRERPYVVKLGDGWYIHFAEDHLAPPRQKKRGDTGDAFQRQGKG